jgi:predicted HicB family RNase H-like nuclease
VEEKIVKKRKFMGFEINPELHQQIKVLAAQRNIPMSLWIHRALVEKIKKDTRE